MKIKSFDELEKLFYEIYHLSELTEEIICLIKRMINTVCDSFENSNLLQADIDTYTKAILILEDVLRSNELLQKAAKSYEDSLCFYSPSLSIAGFDSDFHSHGLTTGQSGIQENDNIATESAKMRPAPAEDHIPRPSVMTNPAGTTVFPSASSAATNEQNDSIAGDAFERRDDPLVSIVVSKEGTGSSNRCRICDNTIILGAKYCPYCGSKIEIEKPAVQMSQIEFSAIAPKQLVKGEYSIIDIVMYEEAYRHIVDELHEQSETETQEKKSGKITVQTETNITVALYSNDIEIEENVMTGIWQNSYLTFSFPIYLPEDYSKKQVLFVAKVFINDVIATKLSFTARCSSLYEQKIKIKHEDILTAFISYASQDRKKVATIVQGMQKARPDMDLFFDVESLRCGEDWEKTLFREIEKRDVFYLCWSQNAKNSEWVDKEWRYAYSQKGIDSIEPIPIDLPEECPPPHELSKKHWNDKLLYLIDYAKDKASKDTPINDG